MIKIIVFSALVAVALADLRMASQPKSNWQALDRNRKVPFVVDYAVYMEPSDFGYQGLKNQRQKAYDNFLRSNIDNEQDRRNFQTEPGKDHLPFRSYETASSDASATVERKIPSVGPDGLGTPGIKAEIGKAFVVPLRWNNPHASELEVNIWLMRPGNKNGPIVVPIRKPTCSGEGHQDNAFQFVVPNDFLQLPTKVPGFKGCQKMNDCILQIYAHSVESRTYAMGTPLFINGQYSTNTATDENAIAGPGYDIGTQDITNLRPLCMSSADPAADITNAVPRKPRLVSDVFNHAYQNSDFSPYSGQQPEAISQNLQASAILKMTVGNRGELGKQYFAKTNPNGAKLAKALDKKARNLIRVYEGIANQLISMFGKEMMNEDNTMASISKSNTHTPPLAQQKTERCFRCAEVGAVVARRLTTNTYVPSFVIPANVIEKAKAYIAPIYNGYVMDGKVTPGSILKKVTVDGQQQTVLQIYMGVLDAMKEDFANAGKLGVHYLGAVLKNDQQNKLATMEDKTKFIKVDASGKADKGYYAASLVQKLVQENKWIKNNKAGALSSLNVDSYIAGMGLLGVSADRQADPNGVMGDSNCDNDATFAALQAAGKECYIPGTQYPRPGQLFPDVGQIEQASTTNSATSVGSSVVAAAVVLLAVGLQL